MSQETELAKKNLEISLEFSRYVLAHPDLEKTIPEDALVVFEVDEDPELTAFNKSLAQRNRDPAQPIITVHIKRLAPTRLIEPEVKSTIP